ncbi:hypothetical protein [Candidatus Igneacidithiobacillus taiwanensis]|uniref:hypothetical protein n=1 Tax=Candidatus Igneacidithiobacillus taiwanensis TaxID=1945924 RepID=UPI00289B5C39|nr:hypothetical protein [Candidatus Igneacidithiobacillus taiwanensis]MCE5359723.1 hypothetical protein [Acidithiobacillus sp.]
MNVYERRLLRSARKLDDAQREQLLAFAEFLVSRRKEVAAVTTSRLEPLSVPAREGETVVGAIKRLRESYHMLDAKSMLNDTAAVMSKHAVGGLPAAEAIQELEALFQRHYERYSSDF